MATEYKGDILKVRLGNDTRRFVLYNTHISYDDLVLMLQRIYDGQLKGTDDVTLKYYDDDNDLITIADAADFAHAREYSSSGVVKMVVFVNGRDVKSPLDVTHLRKELAVVRDKVNLLVDSLDVVKLDENTHNMLQDTSEQNVEAAVVTRSVSAFDPLKPLNEASAVATIANTQMIVPANTTTTSSSDGATTHLFSGPSTSFLDSSQQNQATTYPHSTVPPISSTPQTTSGYPLTFGKTNYTGGYSAAYPNPQVNVSYQSSPSSTPYPSNQGPPSASYIPYANTGTYQQPNYPPGQGPPPAGRGYNPYPRTSPYRVGY